MATKAEIEAQIQTINDGGLNTAVELRRVLGNSNPNSFIENIYGDVLVDSQISQAIFTVQANVDFTLNIAKVGRLITVTGFAENKTGTTISNLQLTCIHNGYKSKQNLVFYGWSDAGRVSMTNNIANGCLLTLGTILVNERIGLSITYASNI